MGTRNPTARQDPHLWTHQALSILTQSVMRIKLPLYFNHAPNAMHVENAHRAANALVEAIGLQNSPGDLQRAVALLEEVVWLEKGTSAIEGQMQMFDDLHQQCDSVLSLCYQLAVNLGFVDLAQNPDHDPTQGPFPPHFFTHLALPLLKAGQKGHSTGQRAVRH